MVSGYGRELFSTFVPSSARARLREWQAADLHRERATRALLSGALVARYSNLINGPVIEVTWNGRAALTGVLRAARHHDLIVAVGVPALVRAASPQAPRVVIDEILAAADAALFDRPLITVARAHSLPPEASIDRLSEGLHRDVEAGFTSVAFSAAALQDDVDALIRVTAPLVEQDLGLEVELDGGGNAALVLARIDDAGLSLSAVRGAHSSDELGGAYLVVDMAEPRPHSSTPLRLLLDGPLQKSLARVPVGDEERMEAGAYLGAEELIQAASAHGTASRLLDALAMSMRR